MKLSDAINMIRKEYNEYLSIVDEGANLRKPELIRDIAERMHELTWVLSILEEVEK